MEGTPEFVLLRCSLYVAQYFRKKTWWNSLSDTFMADASTKSRVILVDYIILLCQWKPRSMTFKKSRVSISYIIKQN
jgi:hypothetical protein